MSDPSLAPERFHERFHAVRRAIAGVVVGQDRVVELLLTAVFAGGHVLLKGMPGLGRTLLVDTLARVLGLQHRRLQFTPDLLPTDIIGTEVLEHDAAHGTRRFRFFPGPVFANLVLVDEINRSPTRTQSALLEVMQERQVTAGGHTYRLPRPFVLIATENTLDTEGVWRLGEAQVDRFLMSIEQRYPSESEEREMILRTTGTAESAADVASGPDEVLAMQALARNVPVVPSVRDFALAVVRASRAGEPGTSAAVAESVRLGASPRAAQALLASAKVGALAKGRLHVARQDVVDVARAVLGHRLLLDVRAETGGRSVDDLVEECLSVAQARTLPSVPRRWSDVLRPWRKPRATGSPR